MIASQPRCSTDTRRATRRAHRPGPACLAGLLLIQPLLGGAGPPSNPQESASDAVALIPRVTFFGNPDRASARLSPDGSRLAYLAPCDGVLNVWVAPTGDLEKARAITHAKKRGIRLFFWAYTNRHILYLQDQDGDENWHVFVTNIADGKTRDLTPFDAILDANGRPVTGPDGRPRRPTARIQEVSPKHPEQILIALNKRDARFHDLYKVDIRSANLEPAARNEQGFVGFLTDADLRVRFGLRVRSDGGAELLERTGENQWKRFLDIPAEDTLTTEPIGFDKTGRVLYLIDSRGRNTAALTEHNLDDGSRTVIAQDARSDAAAALIHPTEKTVQAVSFEHQRLRWEIVDEAIRPDFRRLRAAAEGDFHITSRTLDDRRWTVAYKTDNGPLRYYLYDRDSGGLRLLFTNRRRLENQPLARMHPVIIRSRDGLNLVSYLTLPVGSNPVGTARPRRPLPMVLEVHGGPWARDSWGYDPVHQWLANRGYAVLSVNFRGSTGFGKNFVNAGDRQWAGRMHDDLIDAVRWAIAREIADPTRVAIMGASYGGYAALIGLTFTPEVFACGVDIVGPSNLVTLLESIPPYWTPIVDLFAKRIGDCRSESGRALLWARSPLRLIDRIRSPLLIGQGANDPRVKQAESDQIIKALKGRGIPVTYVLYSDEGHGFGRPENRLAFYAVAEAFLAQHLGGRVEPIGDDFVGSSIRVPAGANQIRGLAESLAGAVAGQD